MTAMKIRLKNSDIQWLLYTVLMVVSAICLAFSEDKQLPYLATMAFVWSAFAIASGKIRLDIGDAFIFTGMLLFMWMYRGWFTEGLAYAFMCLSVYQAGKCIAGRGESPNDGVVRAMYMTVMMACAFLARGLLNYDYIVKWKRGLKVFWFRIRIEHDIYDDTIVRTEQAFYLVLMSCLLICFAFILVKKSVAVGLAGIVLASLSVWLDVYKKGRMVACCAIVTIGVVLIAAGIEKKLYKRRWIQITGAVALIAVIAFIGAIALNLFGLHDMYEKSFWVRDGGILGNVRFRIMKNALTEMVRHPLTGSDEALFFTEKEQISSMAHNSWLDVGMQSGIVPFLLTVAFTVTNVISLFNIWRKSEDIYKYVLIAGFIGLTLYNMFEPAILNYFLFWIAEVFVGGLANGAWGSMSDRKEIVIKLRDQ